jgi:hypothetical protein
LPYADAERAQFGSTVLALSRDGAAARVATLGGIAADAVPIGARWAVLAYGTDAAGAITVVRQDGATVTTRSLGVGRHAIVALRDAALIVSTSDAEPDRVGTWAIGPNGAKLGEQSIRVGGDDSDG